MPILGGIHANRAKERPPHDLGAAEAALRGDRLHASRGLLQAAPRGFDPGALDEARGGHPDLAGEHAPKLP